MSRFAGVLALLSLLMLTVSAAGLSMPLQFGSPTFFPVSMAALKPINIFSSSISGGNASPLSNINVNQTSTLTDQFSLTDPNSDKWVDHPFVPSTTPDPVSDAYFNAPAITQDQKDRALKIASSAPVCKEYNTYPDEGWGDTWSYPYDGHTIIVDTIIGGTGGSGYSSDTNAPYGHLSITVNINTGSIVNSGFTDWNKYW